MAAPRRAASVVVLRGPTDGRPASVPSILFVRRHAKARFLSRTFVFPGGCVDAADDAAAASTSPADAATTASSRQQRHHDAAFRAAACREVAEEVGLTVSPTALHPFAHWITPASERFRYDTRFYVCQCPGQGEAAAAPPLQLAAGEIEEATWLSADEAIAAHHCDNGNFVNDTSSIGLPSAVPDAHRTLVDRFALPLTTLLLVELLVRLRTVSATLAWCDGRDSSTNAPLPPSVLHRRRFAWPVEPRCDFDAAGFRHWRCSPAAAPQRAFPPAAFPGHAAPPAPTPFAPTAGSFAYQGPASAYAPSWLQGAPRPDGAAPPAKLAPIYLHVAPRA